MSTLPRVLLEWSVSSLPLADFLRYQVYRRAAGKTVWDKLARINGITIGSYEDFTAVSGQLYEYVITQVEDVAGEEVESEFSEIVTAIHNFRGTFLHDFNFPSRHTELMTSGVVGRLLDSEVSLSQIWSEEAPIAHIGKKHASRITLPTQWVEGEEKWEEVEALVRRQRDNAARLVFRDRFGEKMFVIISRLTKRSGRATMMGITITITQITFDELVA